MSLLGTLGTLSLIYLFYILARLSERLGSVEKMPPIYRYYYVAIFFLSIGFLYHLLAARFHSVPESFPHWFSSSWFLLLVHYLPLAVGVTIGLYVTWRYWSWLVTKN
jgi:hypothetical protein